MGLAFGGKQKDVRQYVESLRRASGQKDKERVEKKKTNNPGSVFASLAGLGTVNDYVKSLE